MNGLTRWSRILTIAGLAAMVIGALDPLEGSLIILPGSGAVALGALLGESGRRRLLYLAFALVGAGVVAMLALSWWGGIGGGTGRSNWWALVVLPYPVGWIMGLVGAILTLRDSRRRPQQTA